MRTIKRAATQEQIDAMSANQKLEFFTEEAKTIMKEKGCMWRDATHAVKKKYAEAYEAFGGPPPAAVV